MAIEWSWSGNDPDRPLGGRDEPMVAIAQSDLRVARAAKLQGGLGHSSEHRRNVGRRLRDNSQNIRRRGLLFQRFPQLAEQPRIPDGDHRLVGKGF